MSVILSWKLDGISCALYYKKGKLIAASTRGDGKVGENILRNVIKMKNVKQQINNKDVTLVVGEILLDKEIFKSKYAEEYVTPRNCAAGFSKELKGTKCHDLTFIPYGLSFKDKEFENSLLEEDRFKCLDYLGFKHVYCKKVKHQKNFLKTFKDFEEERASYLFEVDGVVVTYNNTEYQNKLGRDTVGNPKFKMAIKFPPDRKKFTLKDIEWSMGSGGHITPVAIMKPRELGGVTVSRVSMHNMDNIKELWGENIPCKGDKVEVVRSGDVIPFLTKVLKKNKDGKELGVPKKCPVCEKKKIAIEGPFVVCKYSKCEGKQLGDLYKWINYMKDHFKFKGIGGETIYKMHEIGLIKTPADLYKVKPKDIIYEEFEGGCNGIEGVKKKSAQNILSFQKHTEMPLNLFLGALNINNLGRRVFESVTAEYDLDDLLSMVENNTWVSLCDIEGISEVRAKLIIKGIKSKRKQIKKLLKFITIEEPKEVGIKLEGISFCFTGKMSKPRSYFENIVKENGGTCKAVSSNLDYLILGEGGGGKKVKAEKLDVTTMNEEQFLGLI